MMRTRKDERGFVLVFIALGLVVFLLVVGFAVDLGSWYLRAAKLQRAADSAALAAASALPDVDLAKQYAEETYRKNGFENGKNNINITMDSTLDTFSTSAQDTQVSTYFTKFLFNHITLKRESTAERAGNGPDLGSPYNVLGTGDLDIDGLPEPMNYWLAMNLPCSPREDGDYFAARREGNKGPFSTAQDANRNYLSPSGWHNCDAGVANPNYQQAAYSYFIDVPAPSVASGNVEIWIYDPGYNSTNVVLDSPGYVYPDKQISLGNDTNWVDGSFGYDLLDTNGTPSDYSDDIHLLAHPQTVSSWDPRFDDEAHQKWWHLGTIPAGSVGPDGGTYRVQLIGDNQDLDETDRGINSFSIGAFPTWMTPFTACDSRTDTRCPKVYGRSAMSVNTQLSGGAGSTVDFFFAKIDPAYIGQTFDVMMWDPGEGVQKIELLMPNNEPMRFNWSADPDGGAGYSGSNAMSIATDGVGPSPPGFKLSNDYIFNGRLLTLKVTIPPEYAAAVDTSGSDWLRLRYTIGTAEADRTTWGITTSGGGSGNPHLIRTP